MPLTIGIDIGTSSTKAVVVDEKGSVLFAGGPTYDFDTPQPLWAENDPQKWWDATLECLKTISEVVDSGDVVGIGLTGQMHGLVLLDENGDVLRPCIQWNDQRTAAQCDSITNEVGFDEVIRITGNPILTGFTAPKIRWVQENEPEIWAKVAKILLPKDYIRYKLSGEFATDVSDASGMSLLDVGQRKWSSVMTEVCKVSEDMLAKVYESQEVSAKLGIEVATEVGLPAGLPIIAGAGDQAAGAIGSGVVNEGTVACSLGTSGVVFAQANQFAPEPEGRLHAFCAAVPGTWHYMGVQLSCAGSNQWFTDELGAGVSFRELDDEAAKVAPGCEGLLFHPYLTGERMPHADPLARGSFIGLTLRHTRGHLARAVLEGVTLGLREGLDMMRDLGIATQKVIVTGGGANSPLWKKLLADIFKSEIVTVNASEGGAFGSAILAMVGAGAYPDLQTACSEMIKETGKTIPSDDAAIYDQALETYRKIYPALKEIYPELCT
ncbi:MAG: xylulokinase [Opitutales bacterium]|nr:xylulokinase [Opitutales bacterium]